MCVEFSDGRYKALHAWGNPDASTPPSSPRPPSSGD
jgi:hypothetical protein